MEQTLVVGDIHTKLYPLLGFLETWKGNVIFTGDYFDDFGDDAYSNMRVAEWLRENLDNPKYTFLIGNHDFQYMTLPFLFYCSGFNEHKHEAINKILKKSDWEKFKFFHHVDHYWFSHAGITSHWFAHPIEGLTVDNVYKTIEKCDKYIMTGPLDNILPLWAADMFRGGLYKKGGLLWNDWNNREFIPNVTQVMGHTPQKSIIIIEDEDINSSCINVDAYKSNNELLIFTKNDLITINIS
jgi:hypothetical protein